MYIIASLLFIVGIAAGAVYGFMVEKSAMDMVIFIVAGGFAGSAAGGLVFTYLYFTGQNEDGKDIHEQIDEEKMQLISTACSGREALPEKPDSSFNLSRDQYGTFPDTPKPDSIISTNKNIPADTEMNTPAETGSHNDQLKKKRFNKLRFSKFKIPELKFTIKKLTEKRESKPADVRPEQKETDKQKIKRLKKEIKKLKKNKNKKTGVLK